MMALFIAKVGGILLGLYILSNAPTKNKNNKNRA